MDAIELLAREDEFKRLNKQLEKKTESLMREIEHVMQKQDFFTEFSPSLSPSHQKIKKHCCTPPTPEAFTPIRSKPRKKKLNSEQSQLSDLSSEFENKTQNTNGDLKNKTYYSEFENKPQNKTHRFVCDCCPMREKSDDMEFLHAFVSVNVKDKVLPPSFNKDGASVESVCKFLSSKIRLMQEQTDKLQSVIDRKAAQCEMHLTQLAEFEGERLTILSQANSMKSAASSARAKYVANQKLLEDKEKQYREQRSETDKLSAELKRVTSKCCGLEARLSSQDQLIQTLKHQMEMSRKSEQELRDSSRVLSASSESAISRLESQTKWLSSRIEKQAALIDNLRKQNLILATDGAVKCLERDYCNFLNEDF